MMQTIDIKSIHPSRSNTLSNSISYVNLEHVFHKETFAYAMRSSLQISGASKCSCSASPVMWENKMPHGDVATRPRHLGPSTAASSPHTCFA